MATLYTAAVIIFFTDGGGGGLNLPVLETIISNLNDFNGKACIHPDAIY